MRAKFGVYLPMYGGWIRSPSLEEEVTYKNGEKAALVAEGIGIHSVWVPDHLPNPIKDQAAPALEAWTTLTAIGAIWGHTSALGLLGIILDLPDR